MGETGADAAFAKAAGHNNASMLSALWHRLQLVGNRSRGAAPGSTHFSVCPPQTPSLATFDGVLQHLREGALRDVVERRAGPAAQALDRVRSEFLESLGSARAWESALLRERIQRAGSMRELWHLRIDVFNFVSLHHSQAEADEQLAWLNRHFPTRGPRSGFGGLPLKEGP